MFILLFVATTAMAQNRTITGTVTSKEDGLPLPGVSVKVRGTNVGVSTGANGRFSLSVPSGATALEFSSLGFRPQSITIGSSNVVNASLDADATTLSDVVITGYGVQKKKDVLGATSSIAARDIENRPIASLDKAMQGRAAGVVVQANNGIPGGAINVRIRGTGSIQAGTQPLYVVDGVQLNTRNDASFTQSNPLAFLNTNDIESIDILKDAASAAIYGAQAANGVVIITTKKGKAGKTKFNFNAYGGAASPLKKLDVLNTQDYVTLRAEAWNNQYLDGYEANKQYVLGTEMRIPNGATLTPAQIAELRTYNWQDEVFQNGVIQNYELSASGGNDKTTFYISGSYNASEAAVKKVDFKRGSLKLDLNHKATERLNIGASINLSSFAQAIPFSTDGSFLGNPAFSASLMIPSNQIRNDDGSYFGLLGSGQVFPGILNQNIVAVNDYNSGQQKSNFVVGNVNASYLITDGLRFVSYYGLDYRAVQGKSYRDPRTNDGYARKGLGQVESIWNTNFLTTQTLNYDKSLNKHNINALLGFEYKSEIQEGLNAAADGFPSPQFTFLNSAANPLSTGEFQSEFRRISTFARASYNYDNKYYASVIARMDGSSRFGSNNQFGFFPSVQVGWSISEEDFLKSSNLISLLKLKAGYGTTGNDQIANFASRGLYGSGAVYNGSSGITPTQLPNPDLKWEKNETINVGLDFGFWKNRISGSVEVYNRLSNNLLLDQPVQWTSGYGAFTSNIGQLQNRGIEVELKSDNFRSSEPDGFNWTSTFIFAYNRNKVKKLYSGLQVLPSDQSIRVGHSIGTIFTQKYAGVNPATGRPMFYDINDNITYSPVLADRRIIGDTQPEYTGGFNNLFQYKGFELDFMFQYEYGRIQSDGQLSFLLENGNRAFNTLQEAFDNRWTTPGQITTYPRPYNNGVEPGGINHASGSSRLFFKTDYIRLRSITFAYNLPKTLANKLKLNNVRVYAQGTNLFTYDDYMGYDPEWFSASTGIIPQAKNYTFGLQVGF